MYDPEVLPEFTRKAREFFYLRRHKASQHKPGPKNEQSWWNGWEKLGSGLYGEAWMHRDYPELVIKISGPSGWGYDYDRGVYQNGGEHDAWPVFARHCQAHPHPHLPEILHFEQVSQGMAWAVMPKYEQWPDTDDEFLQIQADLQAGTSEHAWVWPLNQMCATLGFNVDLHDGNVMGHPDTGDWIITDPFSAGNLT